MIDARRRGVEVRVLTDGEITDTKSVKHASRNEYSRLLDAGVQIFEYAPTMMHSKVMIVDGLMTSVGSTNFDVRSFRLNDEANLNIYDREFAARQTRVFEQDLTHARRITFEAWKARPLREKVHEHAAALIGRML